MPGDLYALLAQRPVNSNEPERWPRTEADERRPRPSTIHTASVETIDNDRATLLLGNVSL
jgi:hypothetical protein